MAAGKYKLSGPIVGLETKRVVGILAQDAGKSIEQYLGDIVTEAVRVRWERFQRRIAAEVETKDNAAK